MQVCSNLLPLAGLLTIGFLLMSWQLSARALDQPGINFRFELQLASSPSRVLCRGATLWTWKSCCRQAPVTCLRGPRCFVVRLGKRLLSPGLPRPLNNRVELFASSQLCKINLRTHFLTFSWACDDILRTPARCLSDLKLRRGLNLGLIHQPV